MSKSSMMAIFAVIAGLTVWLYASRAMASEPAKDDFDGKIVLVYFKGRTAEHAYALQDVAFGEMNGKKLLHGVHVDSGNEANWMNGRKISVDWQAVESLIYYDDVEDYKKAMAEFSDGST
jgi:hypothetical protein